MRGHFEFANPRMFIANWGTWWKVLSAQVFGGTSTIQLTSVAFAGQTQRPNGFYYLPPPFVWKGTGYTWLEGIRGGQPFSWQPV